MGPHAAVCLASTRYPHSQERPGKMAVLEIIMSDLKEKHD